MKPWIYALVMIVWPALAFSETVEQIVAEVNDAVILLSDLERDAVFFGPELPFEQQVQARVDHQLLLYEAKRFVVEPPSEKEVDRMFETIVRRFSRESEFQMKLRDMGMNAGDLREQIADRIWIKTFLDDRIGFFIFVRDEEVAQYREPSEAFSNLSPTERNEQIRTRLKIEKERIKTQEYIASLRARAKLKIHRRQATIPGGS